LIPLATEWPVAGGFVFVSKATGEVRKVAPGVDVLTEIDGDD
jgi:hypothetical protein